MPGRSPTVPITVQQQQLLKLLCEEPTLPEPIRKRAQVILLAFDRKPNAEIARLVGLHRNHVGLWRKRWNAAFDKLIEVECSQPSEVLSEQIQLVLSDLPRSGRPSSQHSHPQDHDAAI